MIDHIPSEWPEENRKLYNIVYLSSYKNADGIILHANAQTGEFAMFTAGEAKNFSVGPHAIRIIRK